uniref:Uncharacterized protein n=1 Tax=Arundo donax TaxID=35708 RepID=A0A0A9ALI5_ARUDO
MVNHLNVVLVRSICNLYDVTRNTVVFVVVYWWDSGFAKVLL